jgi:hypothetical protein
MIVLLAAVLLPLHFTAPADTLGMDAAGQLRVSASPVQAYFFYQLDSNGTRRAILGYADPAGRSILVPHAPGTPETVWLEASADGTPMTIHVVSQDASGNLSVPSNACVVGSSAPARLFARRASWTALDVPIVSQSRERCGAAALTMVLRYYGAGPTALREVDVAYDPALRGSLITDLAGAARRAGFEAAIATLMSDSLIQLLSDGVPPILLYQNGRGPLTVGHFGVVTAWDASRSSFTLHDGTARPRVTSLDDLVKRWETAGSQALIVRQREP